MKPRSVKAVYTNPETGETLESIPFKTTFTEMERYRMAADAAKLDVYRRARAKGWPCLPETIEIQAIGPEGVVNRRQARPGRPRSGRAWTWG